MLEIRVFANDKHGQAVLVARLDNLGKGASGAAVQNIGLMLGVADLTAAPTIRFADDRIAAILLVHSMEAY